MPKYEQTTVDLSSFLIHSTRTLTSKSVLPQCLDHIPPNNGRAVAPVSAVPVWHMNSAKREQASARRGLIDRQDAWDKAGVGHMVIDASGVVIHANPAARRLLSLTAKHPQLAALKACFKEEYEVAFSLFLARQFLGHEEEAFECPLKCDQLSSGQPVEAELESQWLQITGMSLSPSQLSLTLVDISPQKRLQQEKQIIEEQLRQLQRVQLIQEMATGVAHDFNNVLQVIESYATLLANEVDSAGLSDRLVREIQTATQRGSMLAKRLLAFSRKSQLQFKQTDLRKIVADSMHAVELALPANVQCHCQYDEHELACNLDATLIEQVIVNLCLNARDAMPDGGVLQVVVRAVRLSESSVGGMTLPEGNYGCLMLADNGIGISSELQKHIFEPFFTTKQPDAGTGLGLALVRGIVLDHHGAIEVYSQPKQGSVFTMYFPADVMH